MSGDKRWKQRWAECADYVFQAGSVAAPQEMERLILSVALNWEFDALLLAEAPAAYRALPAIKARIPGLRAADVVADLHAAELLTDSTIDSLDYRLARSKAVEQALQSMALGPQQVRCIPYGVELAGGNATTGSSVAIGFRSRLDRTGGADLLPAFAAELHRLRPGMRTSWVIGGTGPLESRLRRAFAKRDATFVGDREPAADYMVVLSEGSSGDFAALEALRRGTPVVAFQSDTRGEIVPPECGVLVTGGHDGELRGAAALAALLDPRARETMGAAARSHVAKNYSTAVEAAQGRAFLREFLNDGGGKIQLGAREDSL
jgi:hypothetical protein